MSIDLASRLPGHPAPGAPRRRRRPSGEPPPLPRTLRASGKFWVIAIASLLVAAVAIDLVPAAGDAVSRFDAALLEAAARAREPWVVQTARAVDALASDPVNLALRWATVLGLLLIRRWRHLATYLGASLAAGWLATVLPEILGRPRPVGVPILAEWAGFSMPSAPVLHLAATLVAAPFFLLPEGPWRTRALWAVDALVGAVVVSRVLLGVDHPSDALVAVALGMGTVVLAFRLVVPEDAFPLSYRRGRAAHLDLGGRRGEAVRRALAEQLDLTVLDVRSFGLTASGGSTPLRIEVSTPDGPRALFGKLYAQSHLRADRAYKLWRAILYGRLEDERPFSSVRHLVQHEDYMLRVFRDAGVAVPRTHGFVEITPEREYLLVTDFVEGATEIAEADVDDAVVDAALAAVRRLWDAGLAHRDVKPANVLVRGEEVVLVDLAFAEVRPSPWRQAVDLANMMLTLGLYADPARVYERARSSFTPEDLAEAFAAARGVATPLQLRNELKRSGRDLLGEYRGLARVRGRVAIQRWSIRRVALTLTTAAGILLAVALVLGNLEGAGLR